MKQKILFIYNWVPKNKRTIELKECASTATVNMIIEELASFGVEVIGINVLNEEQLRNDISSNMPADLAFVIAEGFIDQPSSLYDGRGTIEVRNIIREFKIPTTHSGVEMMEVFRNKDMTYQNLKEKGIVVPNNYVFSKPGAELESIIQAENLVGYPMFLKPSGGGNSIGIDEASLVTCREQLVNKIEQLNRIIGGQQVIAETYLPGREFTVGVMGNEIPYVLPIICFPRDFNIRSNEVKTIEYKARDRFEILTPAVPEALKIKEIALQVFTSLGARDLIRLDLRQDDKGRLHVIDVNGTPSLSVKGSLAYMAEKIGITHRDFIGFLLYLAMCRNSLPVNELLQETALRVINLLNGGFDNQVA